MVRHSKPQKPFNSILLNGYARFISSNAFLIEKYN